MMERILVAAPSQATTTMTTFNSEFIDGLPILGRNYQDVLTMAPGAGDVDGNPTIHGSRDTDVVTLVDGVSTPDPPAGKRGAKLNIESATPIPGVTIRIAARRSAYRAGDVIELSVTIENQSGKAVQVPAGLSVAEGNARFRVLDLRGIAAADPVPQRNPARMMTLPPGSRVTLNVLLNGSRGYRLVRPGEYRVTLLGAGLGLGDSNTLTLRIRP